MPNTNSCACPAATRALLAADASRDSRSSAVSGRADRFRGSNSEIERGATVAGDTLLLPAAVPFPPLAAAAVLRMSVVLTWVASAQVELAAGQPAKVQQHKGRRTRAKV